MFFGFWIVLLVFEIKLYMIKLFDSHVQESCCKSWNLLQTWDKMAGLLTTRRQSSPLRTRHQQQRPGSPQVNKCQRSTYSHQDFVRGRKCWLVDSGGVSRCPSVQFPKSSADVKDRTLHNTRLISMELQRSCFWIWQMLQRVLDVGTAKGLQLSW